MRAAHDDGAVGYDAIVLAGGAAQRLGGADKPGLTVDGQSLLDRVLRAVADADTRVVVGPPRATAVPALWTQEAPPGGGPVAAVAAGLSLVGAHTVLVLACDLPWIAPAVEPLIVALPGFAVAVLSDSDGRLNYLAAAWRLESLAERVAAVGDVAGAPMRRLFDGIAEHRVPDLHGWGDDCDTWEELEQARTRRGR